MDQLNLKYNSTYISTNLIDELDYVIGGYGKPNIIFLYSINAFLEAFILNSHFYISDQEAIHFQIVSKAMFPEGRPILEMLANTKNLSAIGGIGNNIGKVVSLSKTDLSNPKSYQEQINDYINNGLETEYTRKNYLVLPQLQTEVREIKYLNISRLEDGYLAIESNSTPEKFYSKLCSVTNLTNIQATLPYYSYDYQIKEIRNRGLSQQVLFKLSNNFQNKRQIIEEYFGLSYQSIPPLASILFSRCKLISDIPEKILELREEFAVLRESILKYEHRINDASSIKDQIDAIAEIKDFWKVFDRKYMDNRRLVYQFWEPVRESDYDKAIDNAFDTESISKIVEDLNMGKVAGKGAKKIWDWYNDKKIINRFRGVTDIWKLYENSPNIKAQLLQFENLFGVKIDKEDLRILNEQLKSKIVI